MLKPNWLALGLTLVVGSGAAGLSQSRSSDLQFVQFVFTSDAHYGLTRPAFRSRSNVSAHQVNAAMVGSINRLAAAQFPADGGVRAGQLIGPLDFLVEGGDIANREEGTGRDAIQTAKQS